MQAVRLQRLQASMTLVARCLGLSIDFVFDEDPQIEYWMSSTCKILPNAKRTGMKILDHEVNLAKEIEGPFFYKRSWNSTAILPIYTHRVTAPRWC